jgi:hypothetical protein
MECLLNLFHFRQTFVSSRYRVGRIVKGRASTGDDFAVVKTHCLPLSSDGA